MNDLTHTGKKAQPLRSLTEAELKRFEKKVIVRQVNECWPWSAGKCNGYGRYSVARKGRNPHSFSAHRVAFYLWCRQDPGGLSVCHTCDNPICCNPSHLFLGTNADNVRDKVSKGRQYAPKGELHGEAKLDSKRVLEIRRLYMSGDFGQRKLAEKFGVSRTLIGNIVRGTAWKHL